MKKIRWKEIVLAIFMAVGLWYGVSGSEKVETQMEVRVDYRGIPSNLAVYEGLVSKVSVRVKASGGQLRTLYGREYAFSMDLSTISQGENVLPITSAQFPFWGGVEVIDVIPSIIVLQVDAVKSKDVPLIVDMGKKPKGEKEKFTASVVPDHVSIKGPATVIDKIDRLTIRASVNGTIGANPLRLRRTVPAPDSVDATPSQVDVIIQIPPRE